MALTSTDVAILTARSGVARAGAVRSGFVPQETRGVTPGTSGGFYVWQSEPMPADTAWTNEKSE